MDVYQSRTQFKDAVVGVIGYSDLNPDLFVKCGPKIDLGLSQTELVPVFGGGLNCVDDIEES